MFVAKRTALRRSVRDEDYDNWFGLIEKRFQVHGVDEDGVPVLMKRLRRKQMEPFFAKLPSCLIGIEACATAHHWARVLVGFGHEVKLMPPAYVKAYVKRGKNDAADAEAICEAIRRPTMRFVPIKSPDQQSILMIHRARSLVVRQRTMAANALRSHLAEFGRVANPGIRNILKLARSVFDETEEDRKLPELARTALAVLVRRLIELEEERQTLDQALLAWHKETEASRKLATVPGIGVVTATAIAATVSDPQQFRSGRQFAAWLGLVPQQHSSGSKVRLGGISKQGIGISGGCSSSAQRRSSATAATRTHPWPHGSENCWRRNPCALSPSRWPTNSPGSLGRCSPDKKPINLIVSPTPKRSTRRAAEKTYW